MKIFAFGNEYIKSDSYAKEITSQINIKDVDFQLIDDPYSISENIENENIVIIDVIKNVDKVIVIDDLDQLKERKLYSLHDFDLSYLLKLLKAIDKVKGVKIIGLPPKKITEEIKKDVIKIINDLMPDDF